MTTSGAMEREGTLQPEEGDPHAGRDDDSHAELARVAATIGRRLDARSVRIVDRGAAAGEGLLASWSDDRPDGTDGAFLLAGQSDAALAHRVDREDGPWLIAEPRGDRPFDAEAHAAVAAAMRENRSLVRGAWALARLARQAAADREQAAATAFLLAWCDAMRGTADPDAILGATLATVGTHLGVAWLAYAEDGAVPTVWARTGSPVDPAPLVACAAQPPHVVDDAALARDPVLRDDLARAGIGAVLARPNDTGTRAWLIAADAAPRAWRPDEAALLDAVAMRLVPMLAHARENRRRATSEALLSVFMERAPLGIYVKDAERRYVRANPELAAALGVPLDSLIGRRAEDVLDAATARRIEAIDAEAHGGATASVELTDSLRDDHATVFAVSFPLNGAGDAHVGGFTIDLTERKRAEAALEGSREALHQSEKLSALGSLLAGVSHELNNPLSIVTAQADLILHEAGGDGPVAVRAAKLREAAERCSRIVRTFLAMARREAPARRPVAIESVVGAAVDLVGYGFAARGIVIERDFARDLPPIEADPDQLHQVIVNLLVNAQQALAGRAEPRIAVRTREEGDRIVVEVGDNGPGIPADVRRRIFDPFFTTKPQGQGTGMGLAFSQGLAESHGGTLTLVDADDPGAGALFRLALPRHPAASDSDADTDVGPSETVARRPARRARVALVATEARATGNVIAALLQQEGYQCRIVTGGTGAQALLGTGSFDLVVAEARMPDTDGATLFRWMQRVRPELVRRMIFVTGEPRHIMSMTLPFESSAPLLSLPVAQGTLRDALATIEIAD